MALLVPVVQSDAANAASNINASNAHSAPKSAWTVRPFSEAPKKACGGTPVDVLYTGRHFGSFTEHKKGASELLYKYANGSTCVSTTLGKW